MRRGSTFFSVDGFRFKRLGYYFGSNWEGMLHRSNGKEL
jgi:hypothetical protein